MQKEIMPSVSDIIPCFLSGRQDSNLRPPGPKPGALPGCATPRKKRTFVFADAKVRFFYKTCKFFKNYLIIPCSTNIFFSACTPRSTCSVV